MNIGFDAKRAFHNATGLGNYSRRVIESLQHSFPEHHYFLFTPDVQQNWFWKFPGEQKNISVITAGKKNPIFQSWWRRKVITNDLKQNNIELFHGLSNELPAGITKAASKTFVTIHDLIFKHQPSYYSPVDRTMYDFKSRHACNQADCIIAVSEQTKNDIIDFYEIDERKIKVIYQAIDPVFFQSFSKEELTGVKEKFKLPASYILFVGTIERRKNLLTLVRAFNEIKDQIHADVVVIGRSTPYKRQVDSFIREKNLSSRIRFLKNVSSADLPLIYQNAMMLVYPSFFEGFGLPVAEALASGAPVITSDDNVFREAGGSSSLYVSPESSIELANAILKISSNELLRTEMILKGKKHAGQFKGEVMAKQLMQCYTSV